MSIDLSGLSILADRLELIQTIGRNIAGSPLPPEAPGVRTPTPSLTYAPLTDGGFVPRDERSGLSTDGPAHERTAVLSSLMQALRPPVTGPGQRSRQEWNAALAQPIADLAQAGGERTIAEATSPLEVAAASKTALLAPSASGVSIDLPMMADVPSLDGSKGRKLPQIAAEPSLTMRTVPSLAASAPDAPVTGRADVNASQSQSFDVKLPAATSNSITADRAVFATEVGPQQRVTTAVREGSTDPISVSAVLVHPARPEDVSLQSDLIRKALSNLDLTSFAAGVTPMAAERAGVLASFVLNAHFLPGWPPARPVEGVEAKAFISTLAQDKSLSMADIELLTYLANFGVSRQHLDKLVKALKLAAKRPGLLQALACFVTNLSAALRALGTEVESILADMTLEERLQASAASGNRLRLDLG